ncbi:hypothetical protein R3W88_003758 [Solanum pinnatisectum]|uniref:Alpha/beta hydrolase fold-3 domain-containing protein n=1 Tax=Solanum pinnatisectum TaxID=50273 RepID=A0AAV9MQ95_9SOLN|nr:hypothetical protein R3W88_003758 [Solanum pinnatisectum]
MAEIVHDLFPLIRVYKDGRIERLMGEGFVPPESDTETGVQIKDIEIDPQINLSARLYLPKNIDPVQKIPLFVYFHGGAFVIESSSSPTYHKHLSMVAAEAKAVIVSVNYRLAPEYPLPIAYEDSWIALKWIASHANGDGYEPWIKDHANFNRLEGVKLDGIFLACPYFWGKDLIDGEEENLFVKDCIDKLWLFANPNGSGLDDRCEKVLVYVAGKDALRFRGLYYKEALEKSGWPGTVEVVEVKDEEHVFHLFAPEAENGMAMLKKLVSFLNQS